MKPDQLKQRIKESGNVLFLILIAVALFAALSYAVTQSTRGGGGTTGEVELISSAQVTQYPAGVRTSVMRMIIAGTDASELRFDPPSDFGNLDTTVKQNVAVFYPTGGAATYMTPDIDLITGSATGDGLWFFNSNFQITNIGLSGNGGSELMAFLPGISLGVCKRINEELGINDPSNVPVTFDGSIANVKKIITAGDASTVTGYTGNTTTFQEDATAVGGSLPTGLNGQPFGCFQDTTPDPDINVYYHVLLER